MNNQDKQPFKLKFVDPYWDDFDKQGEMALALLAQLKLEMPDDHVLRGRTYKLLARDQRNDDIILELDDQSIAVVHLTWKQGKEISGFPVTRIYPSRLSYWEEEMKGEIEDYNL